MMCQDDHPPFPGFSLTLKKCHKMTHEQHHKSISGGGFHVCGLYYEGGERLNTNVRAYCVASFEEGAPQDAGQLAIPDLPEGMYWREMSAGGQHTCGLDSDRM